MLNRVVVMGRLTKDPELRKTASDISVATFSLAVDNTIKEADGTRGTLFIDGRIFGSQAESLVNYTRKGSKIAVDGSINQRNFIRQDGTKGKVIEIYAGSVTFLEPKPKSEEQEAEQAEAEIVCPDDDDLLFDGNAVRQDTAPAPWKFDPVTGKPLTPKAKK